MKTRQKNELNSHKEDGGRLDNIDVLKDADGRRYSYNHATEECLWVDPEVEVEVEVEGAGVEEPTTSSSLSTVGTSSSPQHHTRDSTRVPPNWNKYNDEDGRRYYSNNITQESSWVAPEGSTGGITMIMGGPGGGGAGEKTGTRGKITKRDVTE